MDSFWPFGRSRGPIQVRKRSAVRVFALALTFRGPIRPIENTWMQVSRAIPKDRHDLLVAFEDINFESEVSGRRRHRQTSDAGTHDGQPGVRLPLLVVASAQTRLKARFC
jgi:hypothetical protein